MYESYWGLKEKPFRNTPEPKYLYMTAQHEEALARLRYGISEHLGCVVLSGVFGCGKTLILKTLFTELEKGKYRMAFVNNPQMDDLEILTAVVQSLGIKEQIPGRKAGLIGMLDKLATDNYNDGKQTVVVIDEAHVIEREETFEELRMLMNFQKDNNFLISLVLSGQPEITEKVGNIKQLAQRVGIKAYLDRLGADDIDSYISHRLEIAGRKEQFFTREAISVIYDNSGGIPRRINTICDLSLLTGFTRRLNLIDDKIVHEVVKDLI